MLVLAIDPGPTESALLGWNGERVVSHLFAPNYLILKNLWGVRHLGESPSMPTLVIEKIESFGMAVGAETFETCYWSGIFAEAYGLDKVARIGRKAIKLHLCQSARATDANVRCAILDRFGGKDAAIGRKSQQGPLYNVKGHLWSALAVALVYHDQHSLDGEGIVHNR